MDHLSPLEVPGQVANQSGRFAVSYDGRKYPAPPGA
jgi:hypothetical protein